MRVAEIVGTVTLSRTHASLGPGGRWLIGLPLSLNALQEGLPPDGEEVVMFDDLGAGVGARVGFSEGAEAAAPFTPRKVPVDAYCACLLDYVSVTPP